jgi:hypothetical protein
MYCAGVTIREIGWKGMVIIVFIHPIGVNK